MVCFYCAGPCKRGGIGRGILFSPAGGENFSLSRFADLCISGANVAGIRANVGSGNRRADAVAHTGIPLLFGCCPNTFPQYDVGRGVSAKSFIASPAYPRLYDGGKIKRQALSPGGGSLLCGERVVFFPIVCGADRNFMCLFAILVCLFYGKFFAETRQA